VHGCELRVHAKTVDNDISIVCDFATFTEDLLRVGWYALDVCIERIIHVGHNVRANCNPNCSQCRQASSSSHKRDIDIETSDGNAGIPAKQGISSHRLPSRKCDTNLRQSQTADYAEAPVDPCVRA